MVPPNLPPRDAVTPRDQPAVIIAIASRRPIHQLLFSNLHFSSIKRAPRILRLHRLSCAGRGFDYISIHPSSTPQRHDAKVGLHPVSASSIWSILYLARARIAPTSSPP